MAEEVTFEVGDSFAAKNEQYVQQLGEQYEARMRNLIEDEIHTVTQQLERETEQQQAQLAEAGGEEQVPPRDEQ